MPVKRLWNYCQGFCQPVALLWTLLTGLLLGSGSLALATEGKPIPANTNQERANNATTATQVTPSAQSLVPRPAAPPAPNNDPLAVKEAAAGKQALKENHVQEALAHFAKANSLDPGHPDWLHNAATVSQQAGERDKSLAYFRQAATLAVTTGKRADATLYTDEITRMLNTMPPWVDEALNKAGAIPANKTKIAGMWTRLREQAMTAAEKGEIETATRLGKQAADLARENLGVEHSATFMSERELGTYYLQAGKPTVAEPLLRQAATHAKSALGANHPETLLANKALAELLETQMNVPAAIEIYQASQTAGTAQLGALHPMVLENDLALARSLQNLGRFAEADKLLGTSCPRFATAYGFYHSATAQCLQQWAGLQLAQEAFSSALIEYEQALTIQQALLPKEDPGILATQIGTAETNRRLGHFQKAREILQPILAAAAAGTANNDPTITEAKTVLTHVYLDQGDFQQAETLAKQLLEQHTAELGQEHPARVGMLTDLAGIHAKQGNLTGAEKELKQALEIYRKTFQESHPVTITTMNNLGQVLEEAGLYDDAEPLLRQALNLAQKSLGADHSLTLTTMNNLALLHESQGNFDKAEPLYQNVIDSYRQRLGEKHADTVAVINNLAYLQILRQDYAKAAPLFKQVLEIWMASLGEKHQRTLKAMNNLARVTHYQGLHQEAEKRFLKTLELRRQVLGEGHMDVLRSMHDLALLYRDMGRMKESEALLRQTRAKDEAILGPLHPYTFETLNSLASVLEKTKNSEAFQLRKEIFNRRSDFLDRMLWSTGDNAREGYIRLHAPELDAHLALLSRMEKNRAGREVLEVGLKRKGLLLKIASEMRQIVNLGSDPKIKAVSEKLTATRKQLAALTLSGPTQETADKHLETIHGLERQVDELQQQLGQASKRFQRTTAQISTDTLVKHLPEQAALVDFLVFKDGERSGLLAAIVRKEKGKEVFDLVTYPEMEAIQKAVINYRTVIQDDDVDEELLKQQGRAVYDVIWAPIQKSIGKLQKVYVVPDGILNILPFPAMVDPEDVYLARSTDLHILSSSRDLLPTEQPAAKGNYLIMAGPDYDTDKMAGTQAMQANDQGHRSADFKQNLRAFSSGLRGLHFVPLPGAEKEGKLISAQATGKKRLNTILLKNEAQESVLQSMTAAPEILHIATHGFFLKPDDNLKQRLLKLARSADLQLPPPGDNPLLRSGLAFAGINANARYLGEMDTNNDGILTAMEVLGLDLSGTKLAVLSACETGLGEIHEGEGVYGLRRAFQEAGAQSVISSLWEVSDAGTQALMTNLYSRLGEGMSAHQALRESQLDLLESNEWNHPYIWSAFMMVGQ
ncbi:MAG: tetratricopeptide repeat protein [Magnetococcus sp. YQC-5]